jgi:hypothetical protein
MDCLAESGQRLEAAGILLAVRDDGETRIVTTDAGAHQAALDGFTLYSARDMCMYVTLNERDRRLLHEFKKRFGGVLEWRAETT